MRLASLTNKERLKFLFKDSFLYGGASAISKAVGLLTFPILTRHFSTSDFGLLDYLLILSTFGSIIIIFGQDSAVARYFYEYSDKKIKTKIISQSLLFQLVIGGIIIPIVWIFLSPICNLLNFKSEHQNLFKIAVIQIPFLVIINFTRNILKWSFKRKQFLILSIGVSTVQALSLVIAVSYWNVTIINSLYIYLITNILGSILGIIFISEWLDKQKSLTKVNEMLPYAIPCGITAIIVACSPSLQRTFVNIYVGQDALGIYAVASKVALVLGMVANAFQTAWGPFFLSLHRKSDAIDTYNFVLLIYTVISCGLVFVLSLSSNWLISNVATERYIQAKHLVFPLTMAIAIQSIGWILEIGIAISKKSYLTLVSNILMICTVLFFIIIVAPIYGIAGIAYVVLFGQVIRLFISTILAQKAYPLEWHFKLIAMVCGLTTLIGIVSEISGALLGNNYSIFCNIIGLIMIILASVFNQNDELNIRRKFFNICNKTQK